MTAADYFELGQAAQKAGRPDDAIAHYKAALEADVENFAAALMLGLLLIQRRDFEQAELYLAHAQELNARNPQVSYALGVVHAAQDRPGDALASYERALALKPDLVEALNNRGLILLETILQQEALDSFERAIALRPDSAQAHYNRARVLKNMNRLEEAQVSFGRAQALNSNFAGASLEPLAPKSALSQFNLGTTFQEMKKWPAAVAELEGALSLNPDLPYLRSALFHAKASICDWRDYDKARADILTRVKKGERVAMPFQILAATAAAELQHICASIYAADQYPTQTVLTGNISRSHPRIRVAYLSSDFHNHPVGQLIASVIERHDRSNFEIFGISLGRDDGSVWRKRLESAVDRFLDARQMNDATVAEGIRDLEIDILVDLNGHTTGARTGILAHRPAPVQVNFLGYAATMGAHYVDYIIADRVLVPPQDETYFTEKIAALPLCYQPCAARPISDATPSRSACGLPETGFVFCAFNSSFKITPDVFAIWMRLLNTVPGSVLWLRDPEDLARDNLVNAAKAAGIDRARLVFAPSVQHLEDHLARHRLADLFLDTLYYNAHVTASDALWSGLPVLTCPGESYASRVSGSLLTALGLPELITRSLQDYENLALELARDPIRLEALRERLNEARKTSGLFDSKRFTRTLENAYRTMLEHLQHGRTPESFDVVP